MIDLSEFPPKDLYKINRALVGTHNLVEIDKHECNQGHVQYETKFFSCKNCGAYFEFYQPDHGDTHIMYSPDAMGWSSISFMTSSVPSCSGEVPEEIRKLITMLKALG